MRILLVEDEDKVARFIRTGLKAEQFAIDDLGVKDFVTLLESANCCHKCGAVVTNRQSASQEQSRNGPLQGGYDPCARSLKPASGP